MEEKFEQKRQVVLEHIQELFEEIEREMAMSHQEKFALLEDVLANATDEDELRLAFNQWHSDHSTDVEFGYDLEELWEHAMIRMEEYA
ncbi:MAG: hypothetical protein HOC34_02865 [Candidatus Magasanikbacteria bacterium]|jgi:hypothetical protein|nr:hypothetical protein [Candidatus Magasanikbacteria bacterium]MBT4221187.1 hypothetical protein [Candidatus Magasanikbacteria bacterium]MBT4350029.1 hypothetical protein [Candidatus Magasanikbacteria bacterium]MBT4541882.1 hypothetical protein [Candidatus Magasanikbacteria bacterium]MBT6252748.1 hypothetical protein [Candidatus Magasanikbacteria bacterium]